MTRTFCIQTTHILNGVRRGRNLMVVGFTAIYAISVYHH